MVERKQQILMLGGGLMVAFGFMFMGAASLSGLTSNNAPQQNDDQQQIDATLPGENYADNGFDLDLQEQAYLAINEQVIFVTGIYEEDPQAFQNIEDIHEIFDGRVYFSKVNSSDTDIDTTLQISSYPEIIVVGDRQTQRAPYTVQRADNDRESVTDAICGAMRNVDDAAAVCY